MLLHHLGIGLHSALTEPWPLHVCPRTLAVLAEILLLHQQSEHDATALANPALSAVKRGSEIAIIHVWTRLMITLADMAISLEPNTPASEVDDINVEHLQLAVFLFHSGLTLMQKKSLWLQLCQSVLRIAMSYSNSSSRMHNVFPLPLTRLLLLIDYLLHYFYDMPPSLAEQVW
jgi:E3 ubiquitin-protein ligase UBR4